LGLGLCIGQTMSPSSAKPRTSPPVRKLDFVPEDRYQTPCFLFPVIQCLQRIFRTRNSCLQAMDDPPKPPSLPWRVSSSIVMGVSGFLTKVFYTGMNNVEVHGLDNFLGLLDKRKDIEGRERGLLTSTLMIEARNPGSWANRRDRSLESHMRVRTYTA